MAVIERRIKTVLRTLPPKVGQEVVNFALDNFRQQAFTGDTIERWRPRKKTTRWGQKVKRPGRSLLVLSGRLRRSIRVTSASWDRVTIGTDVPYAKAHNDGFKGKVVQRVSSYSRIQTLAGVAGSFGKNRQFTTGEAYSISKRKRQVKKVKTEVQVSAHERRMVQSLPRRRFLGNSPYLNKRLQRLTIIQVNKAFYGTQ